MNFLYSAQLALSCACLQPEFVGGDFTKEQLDVDAAAGQLILKGDFEICYAKGNKMRQIFELIIKSLGVILVTRPYQRCQSLF